MIISQGKDYVDGIRLIQEKIKGSCSMLLLTEQGIIAARDKYGVRLSSSGGEITAMPYRPKHAASRTSDTNSVTTYDPEKSSG